MRVRRVSPTVPRRERGSEGEWPQVLHLFCLRSQQPALEASALHRASCRGRAVVVALPDRAGFVLCGRRGPQGRSGVRGPEVGRGGGGGGA